MSHFVVSPEASSETQRSGESPRTHAKPIIATHREHQKLEFFCFFLTSPFCRSLEAFEAIQARCRARHKSSPFSFKAEGQRASRLLRAQLSGIFHGIFSWAGVPGGLRGPHCVPDCVQPLCRRLVNSGRLGGDRAETGKRHRFQPQRSVLARSPSVPPPTHPLRPPHSPPSPRLILAICFFLFFFLNSRSSSCGHTRRTPHRMSLIDRASDLV